MRRREWSELANFCTEQCKQFPQAKQLWQLLGMASGTLGDGKSARLAFLKALEIDPTDDVSFANYITSCFQTGDPRSALEAINTSFSELSSERRRTVMDAVETALNEGLNQISHLPSEILDSYEFEVPEGVVPDEDFEASINGIHISFRFVNSVSIGHGYGIHHPTKERLQLAYIKGYHFTKGKPVVVNLLNKNSPVWEAERLDFEVELSAINSGIQGLARKAPGYLGIRPDPLPGGYYFIGGF
jgi:hypothetical protein